MRAAVARALPRGTVAAATVVTAVGIATAGMVVVAPTAQAAAKSRIDLSGSTFTRSSQQVTMSVELGLLEKGKLRLTPPGGEPVTVASGTGPDTLSYTLDLACPDLGDSCRQGGRVPARNGEWTVDFDGSGLVVLPEHDTASFAVAVPPARPDGLSASATSDRNVHLTWQRGAEPDLRGYAVTVGDRHADVDADEACGGTSCAASLSAPGPGRVQVTVTAVRDAPGDGQVSSPPAATRVSVPAAAPPRTTSTPESAATGPAGSAYPRAGAHPKGSPPNAFPTPTLGTGRQPGAGTAGLGWPGATPLAPRGADPYPSFGARPNVAPLRAGDAREAGDARPMTRPLASGTADGDTLVPVAMGLVLLLIAAHLWLWPRRGWRLLPVLRGGTRRAVAALHR